MVTNILAGIISSSPSVQNDRDITGYTGLLGIGFKGPQYLFACQAEVWLSFADGISR